MVESILLRDEVREASSRWKVLSSDCWLSSELRLGEALRIAGDSFVLTELVVTNQCDQVPAWIDQAHRQIRPLIAHSVLHVIIIDNRWDESQCQW